MRHFVPPIVIALALSTLPFVGVEAASSPSGQDPTHPRVMQEAATMVSTAKVGAVKPFSAPQAQAAIGGAGGPQREVFGFALASSLADPSVGSSRRLIPLGRLLCELRQ